MRPFFLISNDDGIHSAGLKCLIELLNPIGDLLVMVPDKEQSGTSASFTTQIPLSYTLIKEEPGTTIYTSNGTPVDCVKLALNLLTQGRKPDMAFSGINHGFNGSVAIHYSGTMGAAMEACMAGIPSIGISIDTHRPDADFGPARPFLKKIIAEALLKKLPEGTCLNINIPKTADIKGIKTCRQGRGKWIEEFDPCPNRRREHLYWLTGRFTSLEDSSADNDLAAIQQGYISVVPQQLDMTDYALLERIKLWDL